MSYDEFFFSSLVELNLSCRMVNHFLGTPLVMKAQLLEKWFSTLAWLGNKLFSILIKDLTCHIIYWDSSRILRYYHLFADSWLFFRKVIDKLKQSPDFVSTTREVKNKTWHCRKQLDLLPIIFTCSSYQVIVCISNVLLIKIIMLFLKSVEEQ